MLRKSRKAVRRIGAEGAISLLKVRAWFDDQQDSDANNGAGKYNPETVEDAKRIIAALEKRIGERDTTIEQQKATLNTLNERITAIETASRKKLEEQGDFSAV